MRILNIKPAIPDGDFRRRDDKPKEKVFLEHYSWLMDCALGITHGQREHAEDLVHDTLVQFLVKNIDLASIANIRWYLNGILRNLHLLQLRRATRRPVQQFSLFDHDSAPVGLRAWTSADQLESANSLVRACDFSCYRKETSLAASILILRYFHGYYPGEICLLLGARRKVIYRWIDRGRTETKEYMESPYPLPRWGDAEPKAAPSVASPNTFLRRLRERIFDSCLTGCAVLADNPKELGVKELAHLVSCRACLDRRSRKVGLAHVAERMADDISDRDDGGPQNGSGRTGEILPLRSRRKPSRGEILRRVYTRRRELFEHRPKEISLAFDGQLRATLLVNAATNALNLSLDSREVPNSIAVLSEQEFYFLILDQDDLKCPERRVHHVPLSDDRLLEVVLTPETLGPSIQVVYQDPLLLAESSGVEDPEPSRIAAENQILSFPSEQANSAPAPGPAWWTAFLSKLRSLVPAMNPLLTSAIVFSALGVVCFVFWLRSGPPLPPGELLDRAQRSERAAVSVNRPGVIYEKVSIRTRGRTVERTIYRDAQGIRHPRRQQLSPEDEQLKSELASAGVNWDAPLSAVDFGDWRHRSSLTRDEVTRTGQHLLTVATTPFAASTVLKETLTVRDTDFHAVDRMVELRDSGTVEIAELNYDLLPWGAVNQDWFEPLSGDALHSESLPPSLLPRLPNPEQLDLAELQARLVLNRLHADSTEELEFVRSESEVEVKGIVESDDRKRELISALRMIPDVQPAIFSVDELRARTDANRTISNIRAYSTVAQPSPLEELFRTQGKGTESLNAISQQLFDAALSVGQESRALDKLHQRFGAGSQLDDVGRLAFQQLLNMHAARLQSAADAEDAALVKAGIDRASTPAIPNVSSSLGSAAATNMTLCKELISGKDGPQRNAPTIGGELYRTTQALRNSLQSAVSKQSISSQASLPDSEKR